MIASAVPSRLGLDGIATLAPAEHTLVLAGHAWSHEQLGRRGNLIDVAMTLPRAGEAEVVALARRWGCMRLWRTTRAAIGALLEGSGRSAGVAAWARHLRDVRERTVIEWHMKRVLAPVWGLPSRHVPAAVIAEVLATAGPRGQEHWRAKLRRTGLAVRNAGNARWQHMRALGMQDDGSMHEREAG